MRNQDELLGLVAGLFERLGIPYFVTGSYATIAYGEYRMTNDIDIVSDVPWEKVKAFCEAFSETDFYISEDAVRDAIRNRFQFNMIDKQSGMKIDVMIPERTDFNIARRRRVRKVETSPGMTAIFSSPEDVIIYKMVFYKEGGSDKHLRDIAGVLRLRLEQLDFSYIEGWAQRLGVMEIWQRIVEREKTAE